MMEYLGGCGKPRVSAIPWLLLELSVGEQKYPSPRAGIGEEKPESFVVEFFFAIDSRSHDALGCFWLGAIEVSH